MKFLQLLLLSSALLAVVASAAVRTEFNQGWRFARFGPMPDGSTLPEPAQLEQPGTDDSSWRRLDLPHDWGVEGPFRADLPGNTGKLPWPGIGWYRRTLTLEPTDQGRRLFLDFDGAMSHPKVYVNGRLAGEWAFGYNSFRVEITDFVKFDGPNLIAVRLDNPTNSARWYPGGGINRHVWLEKTAPVHAAHWGVYVTTPQVNRDSAEISIITTVENQSDQPAQVSVENILLAPGTNHEAGKTTSAATSLAAGQPVTVPATIHVTNPALWDLGAPHLYTLHTIIRVDGREVDRVVTPVGIRSIRWDADRGFMLNDRVVKLNGVCNHSDLGALGIIASARGLERQVQLLQEMGGNAIRTSHNPPAPELLEVCDRLGMLVLDEAFDIWQRPKNANDYARDFDLWHERDVVNFVRRDRNHPSVIGWSCGNEVIEQREPTGPEIARRLVALFHREDPSRLVTAACNRIETGSNGFSEALDVMGFNYQPQMYAIFHQRYPHQPVFGSETASCVSSRGQYYFPVSWEKTKGFFDFQVSSYDLYSAAWAMRPDLEFLAQDEQPYVAGEFVWTGFDYLGEPTPYNKDITNALNFSDPAERARALIEIEKMGGKLPSRSSYFGIFDLCGFKKDRFYLYQAKWRPELPMAHLLPHWNWPQRTGEITPVHVYTSGDAGELFLNGKSLGHKTKARGEYRLHWDEVRYEPGELKVVVTKQGAPWAEAVQRTTGPATALKAEPDRRQISADGQDLSYLTLEVVDAQGRMVPTATHLVSFSISGPGDIVGVDNGDPTSHLSFQGREMRAFAGKCLVIVRSRRGEAGTITVNAHAEGLTATTASVQTAAPTIRR